MEQQRVKQFKSMSSDLTRFDVSRLNQVYSDKLIFKDPAHEIHALVPPEDYMFQLCENLNHGQFEYLHEIGTHREACIKWLMHIEHPRLSSDIITVRGTTHIQFDERVYYHADRFDLGAMLYQHIPLVGGATRWLKSRLGQR